MNSISTWHPVRHTESALILALPFKKKKVLALPLSVGGKKKITIS